MWHPDVGHWTLGMGSVRADAAVNVAVRPHRVLVPEDKSASTRRPIPCDLSPGDSMELSDTEQFFVDCFLAPGQRNNTVVYIRAAIVVKCREMKPRG